MHRIAIVLSKDGCHLCERVIAALNSISSRYDLEVRVLDIGIDPSLSSRYSFTIPVVQIDGRDLFDARDMTTGQGYLSTLEQRVRQ